MKKSILFLAVAAALLSSCSQKSSSGFKLDGNIKDLEGKVYLTLYEGKQTHRVDSTEAVDGKFSFGGDMAEVKLASIESVNDGVVSTLFLGNSNITLTGDLAAPKDVIITGSQWQDEYKNYKSKYADDLDLAINYVEASPSSPVAAYVLFRELSYQLSHVELEKLIAGFAPEIKPSIYLKILGERVEAMKRSDVGQPYINIVLPDTAGNPVALSSIIEEGKYVLVDFWASWCPPCRAENPHVVEAYKKYADKGFTVFGVSLDKEIDPWKKAIEDDGLAWSNVSDIKFWECAPAKEYGVSSIPSNFLISPEGIIVAKQLRGEELMKFLEAELNKEADKK